MTKVTATFIPLSIAVLTISDTRTRENDTSGDFLHDSLETAGHLMATRDIVIDDVYQIRAAVSRYIADPDIHAVLITGGTGFTGRDTTPESLMPLFDKQIEGFGELFRSLSYSEIGTSTIQSRAFAGLANKTAIFCMPGSTGACRTAWNGIIKDQLNATYGPCNFVAHLAPEKVAQCESRPHGI
ncbi:MAG: molybdenum cofactor biosynthesis protein B [Aestuariibacter sp.]